MPIGVEKYWRSLAAALVLVPAGHAAALSAPAATGQELVRSYCSGCHEEHAGRFERISDIRKTPEGWAMTLFRMRQVHGLNLGGDVHDAIVRYLADSQGLAPAESAAGRFALERRPNAQDLDLGPEIGGMCGRCHSLARIALQRRDEDEWRKLAHTHVGQWASIEYSASGRDRPWWQIASGPLPGKLAALYPLSTAAWNDWKARPAHDLAGNWVAAGHVPGGKDFYGTARIERDAAGDFKAHYALADVTGFEFNGDSKAILYTGYEWRGSAQVGDRSLREVYAVSDDGNRITGRWFDADHAEDGGEWTAVREGGKPEVVAVLPRALRTGTTTTVIIVGSGLGAAGGGRSATGHGPSAPPRVAVSFGEGTTLSEVESSAQRIRVVVTVAPGASPGMRVVSVGGAQGKLAVYAQIDQVDVVPGYAIARLGGGRIEPVAAQFEAMASTRLPGGELLALGPVTAEWASMPFDADAKRTEDEKFAGHFDLRGRFLPSAAGPNPAREFSGDNVGNLTVVAKAADGSRRVEGRGHLVVTVQRWITPPIY